MQFLLLQTTFKFSRDIHQTVHAGNTSIGAESPGQQRCSFLPEDPFQKEAILNSIPILAHKGWYCFKRQYHPL